LRDPKVKYRRVEALPRLPGTHSKPGSRSNPLNGAGGSSRTRGNGGLTDSRGGAAP
jgi:hypothetical protein